jgi:hypothetical protein
MLIPLILLLFQLAGAGTTNPLERIRTKVPVESVAPDSIDITGLYINPSKELARNSATPGITKSLYLFPDRTYLYAQRAASLPFTIFDKGTWRITSGTLELRSGHDVLWNPDLERKFLMVRRSSHPGEILLIGVDVGVRRFEKLAGSNAEVALLTVSKQRVRAISREKTVRMKDFLMRKGWHPERFDQFPSHTF